MYPIVYSADYEGEGRSRLSVFFRYFLLIPWAIVGVFYSLAAFLAVFVAWFAIVFTGRYPQGIYDFVAGFVRFAARVNSFGYLLTDEFPAFNGQPDDAYPVKVGIPEPLPLYSRLKTLFRLIVGIPVWLLNYVMGVILAVISFLAWFVLVFTAKLPEGFYGPMRAALAYQTKATGYFCLLTEEYPPFWTEESEEGPLLAAGGGTAIPSGAPSAAEAPPPAQPPPPGGPPPAGR